jgi:hypothetical protein
MKRENKGRKVKREKEKEKEKIKENKKVYKYIPR